MDKVKINGRIAWIDTAKAISIICVIIGHTVSGPLRAIIFSFHMPLFFILSAWTTRFSDSKQQLFANIRKSCRHLIVPAIIIFFLRFLFSACEMMRSTTPIEWKLFLCQKILTLLFASGVECTFSGYIVPAIGIPWFLIVLFFARLIYDWLQLLLKDKKNGEKKLYLVIILLTCVGIIIGENLFLFFSLDIAFAVTGLIMIAQISKDKLKVEDSPVIKAVFFLIIWIVCFLLPYFILPSDQKRYLEFASRDYPLFPVCYFGAVSATFFYAEICTLINNLQSLKRIIGACNYLGRNTLYMIYVHCFDVYWAPLYTFTDNVYINAVFRVITDIIAFAIMMSIKKRGNRLIKKEIRHS